LVDGERVTVIGRAAVAVVAAEEAAEVTVAPMLSVDARAMAFVLAASVSVQATEPLGVKLGADQEAVIPAGSPETMPMLGSPTRAVIGER